MIWSKEETLPRAEIEALQLSRLQETVNRVYEKVPAYRKKMEDAGVTLEEIEAKFGFRVRELVSSETEDKRADLPPEATWRVRKEESLNVLKNTEDIAVLMVWLGDKLANMRSIYWDWKKEGDAMSLNVTSSNQ